MKRIIIDVEREKLSFFMELLENLDFVSVLDDEDDENRGMYDSIVSLQKGVGIPVKDSDR